MNNLRNIALLIEYRGSRFAGFQKQIGQITIQEELESALSKFANHEISVVASGRTDTKVHAIGQVINFKTDAKRELSGWVRGVNSLLSRDIVVHKASYVDPSFNARFDAISRTYHYYLMLGPIRPVVLDGIIGWYHKQLNIELMNEAASLLVGTHDFSCFRAANCQASTPVRNMLQAKVSLINSQLFNNLGNRVNNVLCFEFTANAFLYHMIRNIVGALIFVGSDRLNLAEFSRLIEQKNRDLAPPTFSPDGLYLYNVDYTTEIFADTKE